MTSLVVESQIAGSTTGRSRGRPREFDRDEVLDCAMALFWEKGFEAASMSELVGATGVNKSSLYNAFGSKKDLFVTTLERFVAVRAGVISELLTNGTEGLADIETYVGHMRDEALGVDGSRGCFATNTSTELGLHDHDVTRTSRWFRDEHRSGFQAALSRALDAGEIAAGTVEQKAEILLALVLSISVIARSGASHAELDYQFTVVRSLIADWRQTKP